MQDINWVPVVLLAPALIVVAFVVYVLVLVVTTVWDYLFSKPVVKAPDTSRTTGTYTYTIKYAPAKKPENDVEHLDSGVALSIENTSSKCQESGLPFVFGYPDEVFNYSGNFPFPTLDTAPKGWEYCSCIEIAGTLSQPVELEIRSYEDIYNRLDEEKLDGYHKFVCYGYAYNSAKTRILVFKPTANLYLAK